MRVALSLATRFQLDARYWPIRCPHAFSRDAARGYEDPLPQVAATKAHPAFYPERVDTITAED